MTDDPYCTLCGNRRSMHTHLGNTEVNRRFCPGQFGSEALTDEELQDWCHGGSTPPAYRVHKRLEETKQALAFLEKARANDLIAATNNEQQLQAQVEAVTTALSTLRKALKLEQELSESHRQTVVRLANELRK